MPLHQVCQNFANNDGNDDCTNEIHAIRVDFAIVSLTIPPAIITTGASIFGPIPLAKRARRQEVCRLA